jgi:aminoglycoside phosphotransferase (APT) family kinase protein
LLWSRERLTGVVDWSEACLGPPEVDVGHCRLNLTVLFSADLADRFRAMYEAESGHKVDAWWDVHALLSLGRHGSSSFRPRSVDEPRSMDKG